MKNRLIILTVFIFFIGIFCIVETEGLEKLDNCISIKDIQSINSHTIKYIKQNRQEANFNLAMLKYKENEIPYDSDNNIYYFCTYNEKYNFDVYYSDNTTVKYHLDKNNNLIQLIAYNKKKYKVYNIQLTKFPLISIYLEDKNKNKEEPISDNFTFGNIKIFDNIKNEKKIDVFQHSAKFRIRGEISRNYEKKNYTVQFIDSKSGSNLVVDNVLGFDKNSKFTLNSLYEDNSKIRDILSLNSWKQINKYSERNINMKYVEVFINDKYYGLYGFNEYPNEYKLKLKNSNDIIYKVNTNIPQTMKNITTEIVNQGRITLIYPKTLNDSKLKPLDNLYKLIYQSNDEKFNKNILSYIDIDSCIDYFILLELTYGYDNFSNNSVFEYNYNTKKMIRIPWDLDTTWGARWNKNNQIVIHYDLNNSKKLLCENGNVNLKTYLEQRLWQNNIGNFRQKVAKRWKELRSGFLETESFVNYANSLYDEVTESGAREREHERWPDGGYSTDNSFIEKFIRQRLPYLDSQFLQYLDDSGEN